MVTNQNSGPSVQSGGFLNPKLVLEHIGIEESIKVGDFGCGHGYFSIPLGQMVGVGGKVYAVDIMPEVLEAVRSRAALEGVHNIETVRANIEVLGSTKILAGSLDLVILANVLFQTKNKREVLLEAKRVLKKGGNLAMLDWEPNTQMAPDGAFLLTPDEGRRIAEEAGFGFKNNFPAGQYHWGMIFSI